MEWKQERLTPASRELLRVHQHNFIPPKKIMGKKKKEKGQRF